MLSASSDRYNFIKQKTPFKIHSNTATPGSVTFRETYFHTFKKQLTCSNFIYFNENIKKNTYITQQ